MEYLSRILTFTTATMPFKFHPMCSQVKLSNLIFADDVLLFCKSDISSIMVMFRSFSTCFHTSGLQMNSTKTSAYFKGVQSWLKRDILSVSGFSERQLSFKYLGIPITCGKLSKADCTVLVQKLVERIRRFVTKKLSYAGRLVNYSWDGKADFLRVSLVSWEKICAPKTKGGLGIKDSFSWNVAAIGKLWLLDTKGYTFSSRYELLRQKFQRVTWEKIIWHNLCIPKHQFLGWLIARHALQLKDKLYSLGIALDYMYLLCGRESENYAHIFSSCEYNRKIINEDAKLCHVVFPNLDLI
ncbi:uncharacterized protein LOC141613660 [Silene latifolia]|uniref:uncharacterized protein LOC141613660 n=1 Tax=Silene latifolia TaxID=37657 RepID=UPI003D77888F